MVAVITRYFMQCFTRKPLLYSYSKENLPSNENDFNSIQNVETRSIDRETPKAKFNFVDSYISQQLQLRKQSFEKRELNINQDKDKNTKTNTLETIGTKVKQIIEKKLKDLEIQTKLKMAVKSAQNLFSKLSVSKITGAAMMIGLAFGNVSIESDSAFAANTGNQATKTESIKTLDIDTEGNISLTQIAKENNLNTKITGSNKQIQKFYDQGVFVRTGDRSGGTVKVNLDMLKKVFGEKSSKTSSNKTEAKTETTTKVKKQTTNKVDSNTKKIESKPTPKSTPKAVDKVATELSKNANPTIPENYKFNKLTIEQKEYLLRYYWDDPNENNRFVHPRDIALMKEMVIKEINQLVVENKLTDFQGRYILNSELFSIDDPDTYGLFGIYLEKIFQIKIKKVSIPSDFKFANDIKNEIIRRIKSKDNLTLETKFKEFRQKQALSPPRQPELTYQQRLERFNKTRKDAGLKPVK